MIELSNVSFAYSDFPVLNDINGKIEKGTFVGIMGPNGGGKSTFLKLLMGFLTPATGTIQIMGQSPVQMRTKIGYVPQFHRTDRDFPVSVWELILMGAVSQTTLFGTYPNPVKERALFLIEELGLLPYMHQPFHSLSGGFAQRALLARALLSDPEVLFLDEPTANIDAPSANAILNFLEELKGTKTILLVTHDLRTIVERVDRVLCIQGQLTSYLPTEVCEHFAFGLYHSKLLAPMHPNPKTKRHVQPVA